MWTDELQDYIIRRAREGFRRNVRMQAYTECLVAVILELCHVKL